jgi:hypothetical protein
MKKKLKFVWIDDTSARKKEAENLSENINVDVKFVDVDNSEISHILNELIKNEMPDLVIMDHSLDRTISDTYRTGSTAASFLREHWKACPIVSCTGVDLENIDIRKRSAYEGIYPINRISENYDSIYSIAEGFQILKENYPKDISGLLSYFNCPDEELVKIQKIMPKELKENFQDISLLSEFYRWCKGILFGRPGFLYNELWSATYLGLNLEGFEQIKGHFSDTMYDGVFMDNSNQLWWKSKLLSRLSEMVDEIGLPWVVGRKMVDNNPKYFSKCFATEEGFPETVAAEDTTAGASWHPMKLKNTEPHPNYEDMLFFDELRIMKPA